MNLNRLTSFFPRLLAFSVSLPLVFLASSSTALAQGTMTPNQPPPLPPSDGPGTPNQPPPGPPPVYQGTPPNPPPAPPPYAEGDDEKPTDAPKARTGFQIAIRPGVAIPLGSVQNGLKLSDVASPQFAATVDIGAKIIPNLFIGGYLGLNIGGAGGSLSDSCNTANATCTAVTLRIGVQAQYHIIPDGKINPWVGYGIGYEATSINESVGALSVSTTAAGVEFAHLMAGVDFRISRVFGIGPFADLAVAQYSSFSSGNSNNSTSQDITDKALHEWLTIGAKITFFP
jgi:hypothetical protein